MWLKFYFLIFINHVSTISCACSIYTSSSCIQSRNDSSVRRESDYNSNPSTEYDAYSIFSASHSESTGGCTCMPQYLCQPSLSPFSHEVYGSSSCSHNQICCPLDNIISGQALDQDNSNTPFTCGIRITSTGGGNKAFYSLAIPRNSRVPKSSNKNNAYSSGSSSSAYETTSFTSDNSYQATDVPLFKFARILDEAGNLATFGEFPWQAAIIAKNYTYICGGALIHKSWIITAAHCVNRMNPSSMMIRLGQTSVSASGEPSYQEINVVRLVLHPQFNAKTLANDIALIQLRTPAVIKYYINPVCLPIEYGEFAGMTCTVSGWGKNRPNGEYSEHLKKIDVPVITNSECQSRYQRNSELGSNFKLDQSFLCAGERNKDACKGDGGSPLVCERHGVFVLAGIVSWGIGCGDRFPGVYTRVSSFIKWINSLVNNNNYAAASYDGDYTSGKNQMSSSSYSPISLFDSNNQNFNDFDQSQSSSTNYQNANYEKNTYDDLPVNTYNDLSRISGNGQSDYKTGLLGDRNIFSFVGTGYNSNTNDDAKSDVNTYSEAASETSGPKY